MSITEYTVISLACLFISLLFFFLIYKKQEKTSQAGLARPEPLPEKHVSWLIRKPEKTNKIKTALAKKEPYLQDIAETLPGVVFQFYARTGGEYGLHYLSGRAEELFDLPSNHDDPFRFFVDHLEQEDLEPFFQSIALAVQDVTPWEFEGRYNKPSGGRLWLKGMSRPASVNANEVLFNGLILDITRQKEAELAMSQSEQRFKAIFDIGPQGIHILRKKDWTIVEVNQAFCKILDLAREEIIGKQLMHLTCFSGHSEWTALRDELLAQGHLQGKRTTIRDQKGNKKEILFSSSLVELNGEECVITSFIDITEQSKLEQQLLHLQKMEALGQLAGGLAHDFKNMLTGIMGAAELLAMQGESGLKPGKYLRQIIEITEQASVLTGQLLDFSYNKPTDRIRFELCECLTQAVEILKHCLEKKVEIQTRYAEEPLFISGDPAQLQNAILNLGLNARDAMPHGGVIKISSEVCTLQPPASVLSSDRQAGMFVKITVTDQGEGIPHHLHSKIFEPFFTTKPKGKGTGLGLASVYAMVNRHHGWIDFHSTTGKGSSFMLFLPLTDDDNNLVKSRLSQSPQADCRHAGPDPKRPADNPS